MKRRHASAALALLALVAVATTASVVARGLASEGAHAAAWTGSGQRVVDATLSPGVAHRLMAEPASTWIVAGEFSPLAGEAAVLESFVREGGDLWLIGPDPRAALPEALAGTIRPLRGEVFASNGSAPEAATTRHSVSQSGFLALDAGAPWISELSVGAEAFRDENGDGRLEIGEPGGPFVVGAVAELGEGAIHVVGLSGRALPGADLVLAVEDLAPEGPVVLSEPRAAPAWTIPGVALARAIATLALGGVVALLVLLGLALVGARSLLERRADDGATHEDLPARAWRDALRSESPTHPALTIQGVIK